MINLKSVKEVAMDAKQSECTIRKWAKERRFTFYRPGGKIMIDADSFCQFMEQSKVRVQIDPDVRALAQMFRRKIA
jgi:excisionase family DNA binding protein